MIRIRHLGRFTAGNWRLLIQSLVSSILASLHRAPGQEFAVFGRKLGLKGVVAGEPFGAELLLTPVNITRYWEFPFVWRHLPRTLRTCLDVGSPRLFSLYVASRRRHAEIRILNPDVRDADVTTRTARTLGTSAITVDAMPVSTIASQADRYDAVWSISVLEHIPNDGDIEAMKVMYAALAPGGRLLVTVPVDRMPWDEYRSVDTYELGLEASNEGYFFQRWYDESALRARLIDPIVPDSASLEWFGERVRGRFTQYVEGWLREGSRRTVGDPLEIGRHYQSFATWREMPGQGVCGLAIAKRP